MVDQKSIVFSWIFGALISISIGQVVAQDGQTNPEYRGEDGLRIIFYNLENLFDTFDDPATRDKEFTPDGAKNWIYSRYK